MYTWLQILQREDCTCPAASGLGGAEEHRSGRGKVSDTNRNNQISMNYPRWGLDYVVLTSVDRDDVPDAGSAHIAQTIR